MGTGAWKDQSVQSPLQGFRSFYRFNWGLNQSLLSDS